MPIVNFKIVEEPRTLKCKQECGDNIPCSGDCPRELDCTCTCVKHPNASNMELMRKISGGDVVRLRDLINK